jgi:nucleoid DNA-binding protein
MQKLRWAARAALFGTLGLFLCLAAPAQTIKVDPGVATNPKVKAENKQTSDTLAGRIAAGTKLKEEDVTKVIAALGPIVRDKLRNGERVELPGLGVFRVVRIPEHKDLIDGRPGTIAATNYVEFLPVSELVDAANSADATPAVTVPPFEFHPLPDQTKSEKVPPLIRMPNVRTR